MTHPHIVKAFDEELGLLTGYIRTMGEFAATQFADAVRALLTGDWSLAQRVIDQDRRIDALRIELSTAAATVIARRQPVATDLDEVLATLRIAEDLERIGDHATHIAEAAYHIVTGHGPESERRKLDESSIMASAAPEPPPRKPRGR